MKTKWVATLNAGKFIVESQYGINWGLVLLISVLLSVISCTESDDLEIIVNELPIDEVPVDYDLPIDNVDVDLPVDNESLIIYTDITPDFASNRLNDFYNLDLNNDGIVDFRLVSNDNSGTAIWAEPNLNTNGANAFVSVSGPFWSYAISLNKDFVISSDVTPFFYDPFECLMIMEICDYHPSYCSFEWEGKVDKYLGLRFNIDGQTHYGWARLDVNNSYVWVIKDYAYNATPNKSILAGQMK